MQGLKPPVKQETSFSINIVIFTAPFVFTMTNPSETAASLTRTENGRSYGPALAALTSLFFMWGFITVLNDILIPYMKAVFELSYFRAMLIQFSFFIAYFVGGFLYFVISVKFGDPINRIGYKKGIILGLIISATGTALFFPAAQYRIYGFFLSALFILAFGFAILQIAANPYVAILGPERTASSRLNLSQAFNSFGTTIGPILGGFFIFEFFGGESAMDAKSVVVPYLFLTFLLLLLTLVIALTRLPRFTGGEGIEKGAGALKFRHLRLGALAIFVYTGAEVTIGSLLINFFGMENIAGMSEAEASPYVAFYWGGAMIGRFIGAFALRGGKINFRNILKMTLILLGTFMIVYLAVYIKTGFSFFHILPYFVFLFLNLFGFILGRTMPARTLTVFSVVPVLLLLLTITTGGMVAMWSVLGIGVFNSIMWSNIFTLSIRGLGKHTSQGSSVLIMFILGAAIIPPLQGMMADLTGLQWSFFVPMICYFYLAWYGWRGHRIITPSK